MRSRLTAILDMLARLGEYGYESVLAPGSWYQFELDAQDDEPEAESASRYQSTNAITFASRDGEYSPGR